MKKLALLFSGQGSQFAGMGKTLHDGFPVAKQVFEEANDYLGFDLKKLCFEGGTEELAKTENTQPAILTVSFAAFKVYMEEIGVEPFYLAGHSLGEISALTCSGAIKFKDAVRAVKQRGKFMQEAVAIGAGAMTAVSGIDEKTIIQECEKISTVENIAVVSNFNSPDQIVISGHKNAVDCVGNALKQLGAKVTSLNVSAPFHSPLMQPAADKFKKELLEYEYGPMAYPVISNVTGLPYEGPDRIVDYLTRQIVKPVQWINSMKYLENHGVEIAVEIGMKTVLRNMMKKNSSIVEAYSYDNEQDVQKLKQICTAGSMLSGRDRLKLMTRCMAIAVCTRNTNWDNDEYHKGVVEPYKKIQALVEDLEKSGREPAVEQMEDALEMLRSVFVTKRTPVAEQIERFSQVFGETGTKALFPGFRMPA
jgi:[acyl-carrier-protein] S-malonyltransferase